MNPDQSATVAHENVAHTVPPRPRALPVDNADVAVRQGRTTALLRGDLVLFVIGMRINRWWRPDLWMPVAREMGPMLEALAKDPSLGLLSNEGAWSGRIIRFNQVWASFEHLEAFARRRDQPHLAAWGRFMKRAASTNAVGIFHETYIVGPRAVESVYVNMPPTGLGRAGGILPIGPEGARARLHGPANVGAPEPATEGVRTGG
jgi:hypothetical protein